MRSYDFDQSVWIALTIAAIWNTMCCLLCVDGSIAACSEDSSRPLAEGDYHRSIKCI